jgi:hypothetical protein
LGIIRAKEKAPHSRVTPNIFRVKIVSLGSGEWRVHERPDVLIRKGDMLYVFVMKSKLGKLRWHQEGKMLINRYGDVRAG